VTCAYAPVVQTEALIRAGRDLSRVPLPDDVVEVAKHCVLDWLGVTLAGSRSELVRILAAELAGGGEAALVGLGASASPGAAALVNGAAGHALDFDDMHLAFSGHVTAPVLPAALALAQELDASGKELLAALVAGIETECRLGAMLNPEHYDAGFHATATLGTFGAAAACARLLGLDERGWAHALGIAGAQAAGLRAPFGTMTKPLQVGRAAANGLLAARLAARGFTSSEAILEATDGFVATHGGVAHDAPPAERFLIRETLFKYHAACYWTHAAIDAAIALRDDGLRPEDVERVEVRVDGATMGVANIAEPQTGLEGKFSFRAVVAMALLADDTADPAAYHDARMAAAELVELRDRVDVAADPGRPAATAVLRVRTRDGGDLEAEADVTVPASDLAAQRERLGAKFRTLAVPVVGADRAARLEQAVDRLGESGSIAGLAVSSKPDTERLSEDLH